MGHRARPQDEAAPGDRHLRRTWRRFGEREVLPPREDGLRKRFAIPRTDGATGSGAGGDRREAGEETGEGETLRTESAATEKSLRMPQRRRERRENRRAEARESVCHGSAGEILRPA